MEHFTLQIAEAKIEVTCLQKSTKVYCKDFIVESGQPDHTIIMTEQDLIHEREIDPDHGVYGSVELSSLYRKIAEYMLTRDTILFHSSAIEVDGNAYLITAKSGVGKSTHTNNLKNCLGDRFRYINDDKPLLKFESDSIQVYGTPWNGKERRGNNIHAPLKGIAILSRGIDNTIQRMDWKKAYPTILNQIYKSSDRLKLMTLLDLIDRIGKDIPIYDLRVNPNPDSAKVTLSGMIEQGDNGL